MCIRTHIILSGIISLILISVIIFREYNIRLNNERRLEYYRPSLSLSKKNTTNVPKVTPSNVNTNVYSKKPRFGREMVKNGNFKNALTNWIFHLAGSSSNCKHLREDNVDFIRMDWPDNKMVALKQPIFVVSGKVYRASARTRLHKSDNNNYLGMMFSVYTPGKKEIFGSWWNGSKEWNEKELIFTNHYDGYITFYCLIGYGEEKASYSCGDITDMSFREVIIDIH